MPANAQIATRDQVDRLAEAAAPGGLDRCRAVRVVTISASFGAGGAQVGPALAGRLGLPFVDRAPAAGGPAAGGVPGRRPARDEHADGTVTRSLIHLIGAPVSFGVSGIASRAAAGEEAFRQGTEKVLRELAAGPGGSSWAGPLR